MAYKSSGASNYGNASATDVTLTSVVAAVGDTIFAVYYYRNNGTNNVSVPTWNGESFTQLSKYGAPVADEQHWLQVFSLTTASAGTYSIIATQSALTQNVGGYAVYDLSLIHI